MNFDISIFFLNLKLIFFFLTFFQVSKLEDDISRLRTELSGMKEASSLQVHTLEEQIEDKNREIQRLENRLETKNDQIDKLG